MRTITKTEDPNGSMITEDTCPDDPNGRKIRLWSADHAYLGRWCFDCKQWHIAPKADRCSQ